MIRLVCKLGKSMVLKKLDEMKKVKKIILIFVAVIFICLGLLKIDQLHTRYLDNLYYERWALDKGIYYNYKKLIPHFIVYQAYADGQPLKFVRLGVDKTSQYFLPYLALEKSAAMVSYGICCNISVEEAYSKMYGKKSWGFDCGVPSVDVSNPLTTFVSECLNTDKYMIDDQISSKHLHRFPDKMKELHLDDKPIFIKFNTGAEVEPGIFDDILAKPENITGFDIVIHCDDAEGTLQIEKFLSQIEKDFILVARYIHMNHNKKFEIPNTRYYFGQGVCLTYINKDLVDYYYIKPNQDTNNFEYDGSIYYILPSDVLLYRYPFYVAKSTIKDFFEQIYRKTKKCLKR